MKTATYLSALLLSLFASATFAADGHKHDVKGCPFGSVSTRYAMDLNHDKTITEDEYIQFSRQAWKLHMDNMDGNRNQKIDDNEWWSEFDEG